MPSNINSVIKNKKGLKKKELSLLCSVYDCTHTDYFVWHNNSQRLTLNTHFQFGQKQIRSMQRNHMQANLLSVDL